MNCDLVSAEAELPSSSALLPAEGPELASEVDTRSRHDRSLTWMEEVLTQHPCEQRGVVPSGAQIGQAAQQNATAFENDSVLRASPRIQTCKGRRPRQTLADWGGGDLQEVLCHSRVRGRRRFATSTSANVLHVHPSRPRQSTPNMAAWGGSLDEVLMRRDANSTHDRAGEESAIHEHDERYDALSGDLAVLPRRLLSFPSGNTGRRARASMADWGGSLSEILRTPPPHPRDTGGTHDDDRRGSRLVHELAESPEHLSLSAVFPPRHQEESLMEASLPSSIAARVTPGAQSKRRARSVIVRKGRELPDCCSICLDEFKLHQRMTELPCGHCFHAICLREYFAVAAHPRCPYCRADCADLRT